MNAGLLDLARAAAGIDDIETLLRVALPVLEETWGAEGVALFGTDGERDGARSVLLALAGRHVRTADRLAWRADGLQAQVHDVAGTDLVLLRRGHTPAEPPLSAWHDLAMASLSGGIARLRVARDLHQLQRCVEEGQRLVALGDWDWHIADDVLHWSDEVFRLFGHEPGAFEPTYDTFLAGVHPDDREHLQQVHRTALETGQAFSVLGRVVRPDGEVRHISSRGEVVTRTDGTPVRMRGTSFDVTELVLAREEREALTARLGEARRRRRQALEINDNVVQGLVAASYAVDAERDPTVAAYLRRTLASARAMMNDLLDPLTGEDLSPGDLVRSRPADLGETAAATDARPAPESDREPGEARVLIIDDADDIRLLTRTFLDRTEGLVVVGEATDGLSGINQTAALQPDLVVLDMSMPMLDGLQALPRIKAAAPHTRVVVFSGIAESALRDRALSAGADAYATKGGSMRELVEVVTATLQRV